MEKEIEALQAELNREDAVHKMELLRTLKDADKPETAEPTFQLVVIAIDQKFYGIPLLSVREILKVKKITWLPCVPDYVMGVISIRGDIHAVVSLKKFLGGGEHHLTDHSRILLVESGELITGLLADEMVDILNFPESALLPFGNTNLNVVSRYIRGKIVWNDAMITVLNMERILEGIVVNQG